MRFVTLALSSVASVAAFTAWSNVTSHEIVSSSFYSSPSISHFHHHTVTGYTTYCPTPTVITITTCKHHACAPTAITVTEATSITLTDECLVEETWIPYPITKTTEYIVTELVTYCPSPTTFTYTKYYKSRRIPVAYTVTEACSITIPETCIIASTYTYTPSTDSVHHYAYGTVTRTVESTVTDLTTYCPTPTIVTLTKIVDNWKTYSAVTVTEATTLTIPGTCVVVNTFTEEITLIATIPQVVTYTSPVTETTVTQWTTYCPYPTVVVVKTCSKHKCIPSSVTVTEAKTLTFSGNLVVPCETTNVVTVTVPGVVGYTATLTETTVENFTTFCPQPTVVEFKTCKEHECVPYPVTVTKATTLTLSGRLVVPCTATKVVTISAPQVVKYDTTVIKATVTELTTYVPQPTTFTVATCHQETCVPHVISVTEATTICLPGTIIVSSTITIPAANPSLAPVLAGTTLSAVTISQQAASTKGSNQFSSAYPTVSPYQNSAAKKFAGLAGMLGFVALLF